MKILVNETIIMVILNVTPDSFSDGGKHIHSVDASASATIQMEIDGAGSVDVGGESPCPGAEDLPHTRTNMGNTRHQSCAIVTRAACSRGVCRYC